MTFTNFQFKGFNSSGQTGQSTARTGRDKFSAAIDDFIRKSEFLMEAVIKDAAQATFNEAQSMVRIDTGFLINSAQASIGTLPVGEGKNTKGDDYKYPEWQDSSVSASLLQWDLNSPFYFGWVANYARARENKDGFMRRAAQNWPQHVNKAVAKVKAASK